MRLFQELFVEHVSVRLFEKTDSELSMWYKVDKIIRVYWGLLNIGTVPVVKPNQRTICMKTSDFGASCFDALVTEAKNFKSFLFKSHMPSSFQFVFFQLAYLIEVFLLELLWMCYSDLEILSWPNTHHFLPRMNSWGAKNRIMQFVLKSFFFFFLNISSPLLDFFENAMRMKKNCLN